jgi:hypothetical protein
MKRRRLIRIVETPPNIIKKQLKAKNSRKKISNRRLEVLIDQLTLTSMENTRDKESY